MLADEILAARGSRFDEGSILTSLAGAIEQAQRFDLHDDVVTAALNQALAMSLEERRERHTRLLASVRQHDALHWRDRFLAALDQEPYEAA